MNKIELEPGTPFFLGPYDPIKPYRIHIYMELDIQKKNGFVNRQSIQLVSLSSSSAIAIWNDSQDMKV